MKLHEILSAIEKVAQDSKLSKPYIVGGTPRDRVRGEAADIKDIDLTTEAGDADKLAFACSKVLPYKFFQLWDDGHASMKIGSLQLDFSSHFISPGIEKELDKLGIVGDQQTPLIKEMYSRDFTCNTLLQDLSFNKIYDVTGQGVRDIKAGVIRTPVDPNITIGTDPKRILRALRFSVRFGWTIDGDLVKAIKKYRYLLKDSSPEYMKDKANEIVKLDPEKGIKMLVEYGLLQVIPMTKLISDKLIENKMLYYAFENGNKKV